MFGSDSRPPSNFKFVEINHEVMSAGVTALLTAIYQIDDEHAIARDFQHNFALKR